jgi:hypothetical protein
MQANNEKLDNPNSKDANKNARNVGSPHVIEPNSRISEVKYQPQDA